MSTTHRRAPVANSSNRIERKTWWTGVHPSANWFGFSSARTSCAVNEFRAIFRIGKIANVVTKDASVFVDFYYVTIHALAYGNSLLEHFCITCNIILIDGRSADIKKCSGSGRNGRHWTSGKFFTNRSIDWCWNGDDDRSTWCGRGRNNNRSPGRHWCPDGRRLSPGIERPASWNYSPLGGCCGFLCGCCCRCCCCSGRRRCVG